jgi:cytochrome P450
VKEMTTANKETGEFPPLPPADKPTDIVDDLIRLHFAKPEFKTSYLGSMAGTNLGAGVDTLESSLTAVLVHVHRNPQVLQKIRAEIDKYCQSRSSRTDHLSYDEITTDLPYTMACIREAMRISPVIGMSISRVAPPLSKSKGGPLILSGYHIPPGTIVGCNPWALHRNRQVFGEDAEEYRPERWLENSKETRSDMDRVNLIWGGPSRSCPGRHLGELILFKTVPELFRRFDMEVTLKHGIEESRMYFVSIITDVDVSFTPRNV